MMKNILFMVLILCLVLAACHSSRGGYVYILDSPDKARLDNLADNFDSYLKHFSELDSSKDGYYFVYDRGGVFDEPIACLFFYDKSDSITICPFHTKMRCRKFDFKSMDIPVDGIENALPLFPKTEMIGAYGEHSIYGYKKEGGGRNVFLNSI